MMLEAAPVKMSIEPQAEQIYYFIITLYLSLHLLHPTFNMVIEFSVIRLSPA